MQQDSHEKVRSGNLETASENSQVDRDAQMLADEQSTVPAERPEARDVFAFVRRFYAKNGSRRRMLHSRII